MYYLKKAIDFLNNNPAPTHGTMHLDNIFDAITKAKVFVVKGNERVSKDSVESVNNLEDIPFSLPFEISWFEVYDGAVLSTQEYNDLLIIRGVLMQECGPGVFNYVVYFERLKDKSRERFDKGMVEYGVLTFHDGMEQTSAYMADFLKMTKHGVFRIIDRINSTDDVAIGTNNERIKLKTTKGKVHHKIRKIIYIVPKKERGQPIEGAGQVEWSHRWLVRGHWMKVNGLGKNRQGEYCIKGFTWRKEHEKGPEDAPLISDKVRVVSQVGE